MAQHLKLTVTLMFGSTGRNEAALQLTWDGVDLEHGTIFLRDPLDITRSRGSATLPMNDTLMAIGLPERMLGTPFLVIREQT
jgi:hypothetical protein